MSIVTDYIKANRTSCVGLWDFAAGVGNPMTVAEILRGLSQEKWTGTTGGWTTGLTGSGFLGQPSFATIASAGNPNAQIPAGSPGADTFARGLSAPFSYEIMFKLADVAATYDLIGPPGNTNGGMTLRLNVATHHWENVENYVAVPVVGTATPDTNWHILVGTIDSGNLWRLYLDGVQDGPTSSANSNTIPTSSVALNLANGSHANNTPASSYGYVAIYNKALSVQEIAANYQVALTGIVSVDPTLGMYQQIVRGQVG